MFQRVPTANAHSRTPRERRRAISRRPVFIACAVACFWVAAGAWASPAPPQAPDSSGPRLLAQKFKLGDEPDEEQADPFQPEQEPADEEPAEETAPPPKAEKKPKAPELPAIPENLPPGVESVKEPPAQPKSGKPSPKFPEAEEPAAPAVPSGAANIDEPTAAPSPPPEPEPEAPAPSPKGADRAAQGVVLRKPSGGMDVIMATWESRRDTIKGGDHATSNELLKNLYEQRLDQGFENLFPLATALVREAQAAAANGDTTRAEVLTGWAVKTAPLLPQAHLARAQAILVSDFTAIHDAALEIAEAFKAEIADPLVVGHAVVNLSIMALIALLLTINGFSAAMLWRYARCFVHDLQFLFPGPVGKYMGIILGTMILVPPVLAGLGWLIPSCIWLLATAFYLQNKERNVIAALLAATAIMAAAVPWTAPLLASGNHGLYAAHNVLYGAPAPHDVRLLNQTLEKEPNHLLSLVALGMDAKRRYDYATAEQLLHRALGMRPDTAYLRNNLANIYLVQERYADAEREYTRAVSIAPENATFHYNISKIYYKQGQIEQASSKHRIAQAAGRAQVEHLAELSAASANRFVFDVMPGVREFWDLAEVSFGATYLAETPAILRAWLGVMDFSGVIVTGFATAAMLIAFSFIGRRIDVAQPCRRCGRPACYRESPELPNQMHCGQCFHIYVVRDVADPKAKVAKQTEIARHDSVTGIALRIFDFAGGMGFLVRGEVVMGTAIMMMFAIVVQGFVFERGLVPNPQDFLPGTIIEKALLLVFPLLAIYGYTFWIARMERR